jgi:hypothetical protein
MVISPLGDLINKPEGMLIMEVVKLESIICYGENKKL